MHVECYQSIFQIIINYNNLDKTCFCECLVDIRLHVFKDLFIVYKYYLQSPKKYC